MAFLNLLLGHLLGDFVLQTNKIAENKVRYRKWTILHALVITLCILPFSIPFGRTVVILVLVNGLLHFFIDFYKPRLERTLRLHPTLCFFIDQALHLTILYFIAASVMTDKTLSLLNSGIMGLLLSLAVATSYSGIQNQFILSTLFPQIQKNFFEIHEKSTGNITRMMYVLIFYFSCILSPFILFTSVIPVFIMVDQYRRHWFRWSGKGYLIVKVSLDLTMSFVSLIILLHT